MKPLVTLLVWVPLACSSSEPGPIHNTTTSEVPMKKPACANVRFEGAAAKYDEGTNPSLSGHHVGISNIFPEDRGLSAGLSIFNPSTEALRKERVVAGDIVTVGEDRYCVVEVDNGGKGRGWVVLHELAR